MKTIHKSLFLAAAGFSAVAPLAQADGFDLSEQLSVTGFIDMSAVIFDPDGGSKVESSGLDQFEIDFLFDFGEGLSAQVDLEYQDNGTGEEVDIEQAFISYAASDNFQINAGRFLSFSGWETEEPTGLFQYSGTGYAKYFYGGYQQGVSGKYSADAFDFSLSLINDPGDLEGEARDFGEMGVELGAAFRPTDSVTLKAFYLTDELPTGESTDMLNIWGAYSAGPLTLAAEYNTSENTGAAFAIGGSDAEADGYLLMANYAWEKLGFTVRYHAWEVESGAGTTVEETSGITLAPSYAVTENLLMVFEYRMDSDDLNDADANTFAVEALVTF